MSKIGIAANNEKRNLAIGELLLDKDITHICLLGADAVVSEARLDALVRSGLDVCAPVSNRAGNEQEIAVDIGANLELADGFADKRREVYGDLLQESEMVRLSAVMFTREVIETVGMPDEQFTIGVFDDEDYCLRVRRAGFRIWIARGCYVHNTGEQSLRDFEENKRRFEEKWSTQWKDRSPEAVESVLHDASFLAESGKGNLWARGLLAEQLRSIQGAYAKTIEDVEALREEKKYLETRLKDELPFGENIRQLKAKIARRLSGGGKGGAEARRSNSVSALQVSKQAAEYMRLSPLKSVCVFAPMFSEENITDGYVQRVKAIDGEVIDGYLKLYLHLQEPGRSPAIESADEKHISIWLDPFNKEQAKALCKIVRRCDMAYIHSVLRIMKNTLPAYLTERLFGKASAKIVWDVHGSVPEEFELQGDFYKSQIAGEAEAFLAAHADMSIVVSRAMKSHLKNKYGSGLKSEPEILPIFHAGQLASVDCSVEKRLAEGQSPLVVYAGGLQKWQKIDEMQDAIAKTGDLCRYAIFTSRPEEFENKWGVRPRPAALRVERRQPEEVTEEYKYCHYGFALRDDTTVNNVACPTKIIEYIQFGILPILDTPNIGDFAEMGMEYISRQTFVSGALPDENERRRMTENNRAILNKLTELYLNGKKSVADCLPV